MKLNAVLLRSVVLVALFGLSATLRADTTVVPAPAKPAPKTPAAKSTKPVKPQHAPKVEIAEDAPLPGLVQARPKGGFMTVEVVDGKFKLSFFDAKKKAVPLDMARAAAHWKTNKKVSEDHTILNPTSDGKSLVSAGLVKPPFIFKVFLSLLSEDGTAVETYVIDMNSDTRGDAGAAEPKE